MTLTEKAQAIQALSTQLKLCTGSPLYTYRIENNYLPVMGDGNLNAKLLFVGEAPGKKEALTGKPFQGAAGKMLNTLLASINLSREDIYITNLVHDRPPENRDPTPEEIALYSPFLLELIRIIQPQVVATLGRHSLSFLLSHFGHTNYKETISTLHGKPIIVHKELTIVPLYHPAYALYNGSKRAILIEDIQVIQQFISK